MNHLADPLLSTDIAREINGEHSGPVVEIYGVGSVTHGGTGEIGFLADKHYRAQVLESELSVLLVTQAIEGSAITQIIVDDVRHAWRLVSERIAIAQKMMVADGIHPDASVTSDAVVGENVRIAAGCVIGPGARIGDWVDIEAQAMVGENVRIGSHTRIGPGVRLLAGTRIGARCNILGNAVIGERGFGNVFEEGRWKALPQLGGVRIGDDVEIGAGTAIDRGTIDDTVIGNGVKLDNLIQIAHNVVIGDHTAIAGCCVIAGSVRFGKYCMVGGASVFTGHIEICDGARFTGHSSISKSITKPGFYSSAIPVMPTKKWQRFVARLRIFGREK